MFNTTTRLQVAKIIKISDSSKYCLKKVISQLFILIPSQITGLQLHSFSIVSPSLLHRSSIETMDHRWSIDGVSMEYLRRKSGHIAVLLISEMPCIWEGKSIDEKIPTSEPVGTNIIY